MAAKKQTHYQVLGVFPDAKQTDIVRAYNKWKSAQASELAVPDPRRNVQVEAAYKVLSNEQSRAEYDASLKAPEIKRRSQGAAALLGGLAVLGGVAAASWYFVGSKPPPAPTGRPLEEIKQAASLAVGRLDRIDISGATAPIGVVFAVDQNQMVTTCNGISPGALYMVHLSPRNIPARVMTSDESLGLCKLSVDGVGSNPLSLSSAEPRAGDRIYATKINAVGEVTLIEGTVKSVTTDPDKGRVIEASMPVAPASGGAPLLDMYGRVVGVASVSKEGRGRHLTLPSAWNPDARPVARSAPEPAPATETASSEPKPAPEFSAPPRSPKDISPQQREALEKAFRPPPNVPNDL